MKPSALIHRKCFWGMFFWEDLAQAQMKSIFPLCIGAVCRYCWLLEFEGSVDQQIYSANLQFSWVSKLSWLLYSEPKHQKRYIGSPCSQSRSLLLFPCLGITRHVDNTKPCHRVIDDSFPVWFNFTTATPGFDLHISASAVSLPWLNTWKVEAFKHFDHVPCSPSKTLT